VSTGEADSSVRQAMDGQWGKKGKEDDAPGNRQLRQRRKTQYKQRHAERLGTKGKR